MNPSGYVPGRGDVVFVDCDPQAGHEQAGRRPAVVLSSREFNRRMKVASVCPVTTKPRGIPFEVVIPPGMSVTGVVLYQHGRSLDWKARNASLACRLDAETVSQVTDRMLSVIDPEGEFGPTESAEG